MIPDVALNRIRDLISDDIYSAVYGTSQQIVSITDTDLIAELAGTEDTSPVKNDTFKTTTVTSQLLSTDGNGYTFYEWGLKMNSGSTLLTRQITAGVPKTSNVEINRITTIYYDRE